MTNTNAIQQIRFTGFSVQACFRVDYDNGQSILRPIHEKQDTAIQCRVADAGTLHVPGLGPLEMITVDVEGDGHIIIDEEGGEFYEIAHGSSRDDISLTGASYAGLHWRVLGFTTDDLNPAGAFQMMSGDDEDGVRQGCIALQAMLRLPQAMRAHADKLNSAEKSPDGSDYNELLELAGI